VIAFACAGLVAVAALIAPPAAPAKVADPYPCRDRIVRVLHDAGFRGESLVIAWAIVQRESNGRNLVPGHPSWNGGDWGIWQVNRGAWGGERWWTESSMSDPARQSRIVYRILTQRGTYWRPWGLSSPHADSLDTSHYGSWSSWQHYAWIWEPFTRYRAAFPKGCRS
jgi:hypothetical protein